MAVMCGSSSDIRSSSCVNLLLRHCALKEYIFSGKVSFSFLRIVLYIFTSVFFFEADFCLLGLIWWDVHNPTCSALWVFCSCFF